MLRIILGEIVAVSTRKTAVIELTYKAILIALMASVLEHKITFLTNNAFLCLCLALYTVWLKLAGVAGACKS